MTTRLFDRRTFSELLTLALPMVVSQGTWAVMLFTDRYFLAKVGSAHIAAALGGGVMFFVSMALFVGVLGYANALVAQYYGAGRYERCPQVVTQGVIISLAVLPLVAVLGYFMVDLFAAMGHDPRQVVLEKHYYQVLMAGSLFHLLKVCMASYFAGISRAKVVMVADLIGIVVNVPLTYALIYGAAGLPQLGIVGAALATVVATLVSLAVYVSFYFHRAHRHRFKVMQSFAWQRGVAKRYVRLGSPSGVEMLIGAGTFNFFLLMFQSYGVAEGAAITIVFNWDILSYVPLIGLSIAVMTLTGQYVGSGDMSRANQLIRSGFLIALLYSGVLAVCFLIFRVELVKVFATPDAEFARVLALGAPMMVGMASYLVADAIILICSGVLRGAGDTRWLMVASISLHVLMVIAQYFMIMVYQVSPITSWWCFVAMLISLAVTYLWRLLGGQWRRPERLARVMVEH